MGQNFECTLFERFLQYFKGSWDVVTMCELKMVREIVKPSRRHLLCSLT